MLSRIAPYAIGLVLVCQAICLSAFGEEAIADNASLKVFGTVAQAYNTAKSFERVGDYAKAEQAIGLAIGELRSQGDLYHPAIAAMLNERSEFDLLQMIGQPEMQRLASLTERGVHDFKAYRIPEAERAFVEVIAVYEQHRVSDRYAAGVAYFNRGRARQRLGEWKKSKLDFITARAVIEKIDTRGSDPWIEYTLNLIAASQNQGDFADLPGLYAELKEGLEKRRLLHSPPHITMTLARANLWLRLGDPSRSRLDAQSARASLKWLSGKTADYLRATSFEIEAMACTDLDDPTAAQELMGESDRLYGVKRTDAIDQYVRDETVGIIALRTGDTERADILLQSALEELSKTLPDALWLQAATWNYLGELRLKQNRVKEADKLLSKSYEVHLDKYGFRQRAILPVLRNLAELRRAQGRENEARKLDGKISEVEEHLLAERKKMIAAFEGPVDEGAPEWKRSAIPRP